MIKVGDWVEVVGCSAFYSKGDQFRVSDVGSSWVVDCNGIFVYKDYVRLVGKTEADKRGAKFGAGGVIKATGDKWVFACEKEGFWKGIMENGVVVTGDPHHFRLDHEPEYREIPFSEATHEQRMDVSALRFDGGPVEQIFQFDNGEYVFTIPGCKVVCTVPSCLTVRIPA